MNPTTEKRFAPQVLRAEVADGILQLPLLHIAAPEALAPFAIDLDEERMGALRFRPVDVPEHVGYDRHWHDRPWVPLLGSGSLMRGNGEARMAATRSQIVLCTSGCWAKLAKPRDASRGGRSLSRSKTAGWGLQRVCFVGGATALGDATLGKAGGRANNVRGQ